MIHIDRRRLRAMGETASWLVGRRRRVRVEGESMEPTLRAGEFVLIDRSRAPEPDDLVVARHPDRAEMLVVKRLTSSTDDGRCELSSDNPDAGTDSRTWGPVPVDLIEGTVTLIMDRPEASIG